MSSRKIAVFPGSFDPFTRGHESVVNKALGLFDEIVIGIGENASKNYLFNLNQRMGFIKKVFASEPKIKVVSYSGLTVDLCKSLGAQYILRGLRNSADFGFERSIAHMNLAMNPHVETVFLLTEPELSAISSTIIREIIKSNGNVQAFVPKGMFDSPDN